MITAASYIEERIATFDDLRYDVSALLNWTEDDHTAFLFECGMDYLSVYFGNDVAARQRLSQSPLFWKWWKNHWFCRDQVFFETVTDCPIAHREDLYRSLHNPQMLACEIYPNRTVLGADFSTINIRMQ